MTETAPWYMDGDAWTLVQQADAPERNIYFETVMSQANGLLGVRAYDEEASGGRASVREGYLNGVFAEVDAEATRIIAGDFDWPTLQMVSLPEVFGCRLTLAGEALDLADGDVLAFERTLSLRDALLRRELTWRSPAGRTTRVVCKRFLSAAEAALGCQRLQVEPVDWDGEVVLDFGFDAAVPSNFRCGNKAEPELPQHHFTVVDQGVDGQTAWVAMTTNTTAHTLCVASRVRAAGQTQVTAAGARIGQQLTHAVAPGTPATAERCFAVVSDREADAPAATARELAAAAAFDDALAASRRVWQQRWRYMDVELEGNDHDQKVIRYSLFQVLQMLPPAGATLSIPARALSFNRYRGLYFWDTETFILPVFTYALPAGARDLLRFRTALLAGARKTAAAKLGREGALFPWMSDAEAGCDNSIDGRVTYLQHQNGDIAYAFDQYGRASGDTAFMAEHGLPVLAETARFWVDHLEEDDDGTWHSVNAVGPDESTQAGRDNGFTNLLARDNLECAVAWAERLAQAEPHRFDDARTQLDLTDAEVERWRRVAAQLCIPHVPGKPDVPLQDQFFMQKKPADMAGWRLREAPEHWQFPAGTPAADYQLIKQADIVLAMFMLHDRFTPAAVAAAYDFYEPKTQHISSLSYNTHAIVAARLGRTQEAYDYFRQSAALDLDDLKGVTADGLHAANLGGCWQAVVFGFAGLDPRADRPVLDPHLPPSWERLRFHLNLGGRCHTVTVAADGGWTAACVDDSP